MAKSIAEWMGEGEELYAAAFKEYQLIERQLDELERRFSAKREEVNQIAQIIGKPPIEGNRRLTAQLVDDRSPASTASASSTIARALAGRSLNR